MELTKRPYDNNWSGNPIVYELFDNDAITDNTISFQVKLMAMRADAAVFSEIVVVTVSPYQGRAAVDISTLLHTLLDHQLPPITSGTQTFSSNKAACQFYILFRAITIANASTAWDATEANYVRYAFKGGVHPYRFRGNAFFTTYLPAAKPFYSWQVRDRLVAYNERIYLCWLNLPYNYLTAQSFLKLRTELFFTDQTSVINDYNVPDLQKGSMIYLPVGGEQMNLAAVNPAKQIWEWKCWLEDTSVGGLGIVTEKFSFVLDKRNDYNNLQIHYRNSIGGMDTVRVRGVIATGTEYNTQELEKSVASDALENLQAPAMAQFMPATETLRYRADIGYLSKEEQDRLRDAFLRREAYVVRFGRFIPISISNTAIDITRTDAFTWRLPIDFTLADSGSDFYTPESIDLGNATPSSNICNGAVVFGSVTQAVNTPSAGLTRVTFNWSLVNATGAIGVQWRVPGFQDVWQTLLFALSGTVQYTVSSDVQFTMQMRVQCTATVFGAVSERFVDTNPAPPAVNSNIYNETSVATTFQVKVNGVTVASGLVPANGSAAFFMPTVSVASTIELVTASISPANADLFIVDTTYVGSISGNTSTWINRTTTSAGVTITIS